MMCLEANLFCLCHVVGVRQAEGEQREQSGGGGAGGGDADPDCDTNPHRAALGTGDAREVLQEDGGGGGDVPKTAKDYFNQFKEIPA
jgi:hypothetical protein